MSNNYNSLLAPIAATLSPALLSKIQSSKILLVGSGGIGCELLKNLALSGFTNLEVIDLDTIDVSNLNRQFLFRSQHVGMPKCKVACAVAAKMAPPVSSTTDDSNGNDNGTEMKCKAHHGNVCDNTKFNVPYISQFSLVFNALDNVTARRRVNRLCLAASTPLIEAGTTGYLGQVTVIDKNSGVECYECQSKPTQKVYPICTIRSTPSMPVHTIVWAKEFYKLLFGEKVAESMLFEDMEGEEVSTYMDLVLQLRTLIWETTEISNDEIQAKVREKAAQVLEALYKTEIEKQLNMDRFKTAQKVPAPISSDTIIKTSNDASILSPTQSPNYKQTQIWSIEECIAETISCILDATLQIRTHGKKAVVPSFDKDDILSMRFVTSTSNLRSYVFSITPLQSYYSAKGIAGNIIPAIATTNAIVAGLQVLQAFHILQKQMEQEEAQKKDPSMMDAPIDLKECCRYIYCLRDKTRKGYYLQPTSLPPPNPKCFVCRNAVINLTLNVQKWTLSMLLSRIIKKELGFMEPSILLGDDIIHEEGEGADEESYKVNGKKLLVALPAGGVRHGTVLRIEDFTQDLEVDVCFCHKEVWEVKEGERDEEVEEIERFVIGGDRPVPTSNGDDTISQGVKDSNGSNVDTDALVSSADTNTSQKKIEDEDEEIEIISSEPIPTSQNQMEEVGVDEVESKKRSAAEVAGSNRKKTKLNHSNSISTDAAIVTNGTNSVGETDDNRNSTMQVIELE